MFTIAMRGLITFLMVLSLGLANYTFAQSKKILKSSSRSQNGMLYLNEAISLEKDDPTKALDLLQQSLQEAISTKDVGVEAESYFLLGKINGNSGQYDLAIVYFEKAKTSFKRIKDEDGIYKVSKSLAEAYAKNKVYSTEGYHNNSKKEQGNNNDLALKEYDFFISLAKKRANKIDQIEAHQAKAKIYQSTGKYELSLQELNVAESLNIDNKKVETSKLSELKIQKGNVYEAQSKNDKAYEQYKESEALSNSINDQRGILNSNTMQSNLLSKEGKKEEAVKKRKESLSLFKNRNKSEEYNLDKLKVESSWSGTSAGWKY